MTTTAVQSTAQSAALTTEQTAMLAGADRLQALLADQQDAVVGAALAACECPEDGDGDPEHPGCSLAPGAGGQARLEYCPTARRLLLYAYQGSAAVTLAFEVAEAEDVQLELAALLLGARRAGGVSEHG